MIQISEISLIFPVKEKGKRTHDFHSSFKLNRIKILNKLRVKCIMFKPRQVRRYKHKSVDGDKSVSLILKYLYAAYTQLSSTHIQGLPKVALRLE